MSDISPDDFKALQDRVTTHVGMTSQALQEAGRALSVASQKIQSQKPSLELVLDQIASERNAINAHGDSLDTKAGLVLGFSGVLVGLSATAQQVDFKAAFFRAGLEVAVLAAVFAALAVLTSGLAALRLPGRLNYKKLDLDTYKNAINCPEADTREKLLTEQVAMVKATRSFAALKQGLVFLSVVALAVAAGFVVSGTLKAEGMHIFLPVTLAANDTGLGPPLCHPSPSSP
jgi:hypothetical protein